MISGRVDARRAFPWPPLAAAALVVALAGPAQLAWHSCMPGAGPLSWLGVRLALLSSSTDCPEGAFAVGGTSASGALVVVSVAVPTLLVHLVAVAGGVSLSALLARAAAGISLVLGAVLRALPRAPRVRWVRAAVVVGRSPVRPPGRVLTLGHPDRGPPAALLAA